MSVSEGHVRKNCCQRLVPWWN